MKLPLLAALLLLLPVAAQAGPPALILRPPALRQAGWDVDLSAAFMRKIVSPEVESQYRIVPILLTLSGPPILQRSFGGGSLLLRPTATLLAESLFRGPETAYFAFSLRPALEWWLPDGRTFLYLTAGGGLGTIDSRGVKGGQGQDFTFNALASLGLGWRVTDRASLRLGLLYQHLSNGAQTDPNPGLNSIGPEISLRLGF